MFKSWRALSLAATAAVLFVLSGCVRQDVKVEQARQLTIQAFSATTDVSKCPSGIDSKASDAMTQVEIPPNGTCVPKSKHGFPVPDPQCTPGAVNPTLTLDVMTDSGFRTGCVRNNATTESEKGETYSWYKLEKPDSNTGKTQICELDHLIPLVIGGADTLDNIWPQCGPDRVTLNKRYFKQKDCVETYLGVQVRAGSMDLSEAQHGIASDWTQYISAAKKAHCHGATQDSSID